MAHDDNTCENLEIVLDNDVFLKSIELYVDSRISSSCSRGLFSELISSVPSDATHEETVEIYKHALLQACLNDLILEAVVTAAEEVLANGN